MSTPSKFSAPLSPSLQPGTQSGTMCSCIGYAPQSHLPQKQPPTHFLPLQSNEALFSLVLSLPAVWFQSRGCHVRQPPQSNGIWGQRSSCSSTAATQVLKSPPTLVLKCRVSSQGQRELGRFNQSQDEAPGRNTQMLRYQPADLGQTTHLPVHRAHLFL